MFQAVM
jgi:hypothetical protein